MDEKKKQKANKEANEDTLYARIGGEAGVRQLVTLFYDLSLIHI